jgi:Mg/Co/Ni transporter MgtE
VRLTEVDVGLSGAFRRLFEGLLPLRIVRKLEVLLSHSVIPWEFVDLIETDPQRRLKLRISHERLARLHPADLADIVEELAPAEREAIFETLDESKAADALSEVEPKVQKSIIQALDSERAADILEEMAPDEAADLLAELPAQTSEGILEDMQRAEAEEIEELLEFEENTAGGMMTTDFIAVPEDAPVESAIEALRANRELASCCNTIFLLDAQSRLTGAVPLGELFLVSPSTRLLDIKPELLLLAHVDDSERDVITLFDKYNVFTLPIVDADYQVVGVITADDIISRLKAKL